MRNARVAESWRCLALMFVFVASVNGIRVDWGTNHGPIIPPTSTIAPEPKQPYRDPAPVWENSIDDIPNPNQYRYVPPPPSRARENTVNIFSPNYVQPKQADQPRLIKNVHSTAAPAINSTPRPNHNTPNNNNNNNVDNYYDQHDPNNFYNQINLVPIFVPNYGYKYFVIIPQEKFHYVKSNYVNDYRNNFEQQKYEKLAKFMRDNEKYYLKNKKYKAYEKMNKFASNSPETHNVPQQQKQQQLIQQIQQNQQNQNRFNNFNRIS